MITQIFLLISGHFFGDFVLQNELMATKKNRNRHFPPNSGVMYLPPWYYWMICHAMIHGSIVYFITDNIYFGLAETFLHGLIDFGKCEKWYNLHIDQAMHILCKFLWVIL